MTETETPHLASTHEQYPDGFPARLNDALLGHWRVSAGVVVVESHPHGYEVHFGPCYDFDACDACAPDRGPSNPHTGDGHHFRECRNRGMIVTVAGGDVGYRAVLQYLATEGSAPHVQEFAALQAVELAAEHERVRLAREEDEAARLEEQAYAPTVDERIAALGSELAALRRDIQQPSMSD